MGTVANWLFNTVDGAAVLTPSDDTPGVATEREKSCAHVFGLDAEAANS